MAEDTNTSDINPSSAGQELVNDIINASNNIRRQFQLRGQININTNGATATPRARIINTARRRANQNNTQHNTNILPPLVPQPVLNQQINYNDRSDDDEDTKKKHLKKFECALCVEYMENPVGCGNTSCDSRFCNVCLKKVIVNAAAQTLGNQLEAKCPHCRKVFTAQSIKEDKELKKEMDECTDTVKCQYSGCDTQLSLGIVKLHEATCPYQQLKCRYSDWGCEWVGRKKDYNDHEMYQCEFRGGLGKLLERYRQGEAQTNHILNQHHMQLMASSQMMNLHSRQMILLRTKNAGSIIDVLHMAYEACLFPGRFLAMKEVWAGMISQSDTRCLVFNMLLMIPSFLLIFNVSFQGVKILANIQIESLTEGDAWYFADTFLLSMMVMILGIICNALFYIDTKSSMDWTVFNIKNLIVGPLLRDMAAICMVMAHFCAVELRGLKGLWLLHITTVVTILYTSFLSCTVDKTNPLKTARAWPVIVFGLRYGFLASVCGFAPSLNAIVTLRLLKQANVRVFRRLTSEASECFISQIRVDMLGAIALLTNAITYGSRDQIDESLGEERSTKDEGDHPFQILIDHFFALAVLLYVNGLVFVTYRIGRKMGEKNLEMGTSIFMHARASGGAVLPNTRPTPIGLAVFWFCLFLLVCIAVI